MYRYICFFYIYSYWWFYVFMKGEYFLEKVLFFGDLGIDDLFVIMYGLLYFEIEIVGIVIGYGNVEYIYVVYNVVYIL